MRRALSLGLALVLFLGVLFAIGRSVGLVGGDSGGGGGQAAAPTTVHGLIGSEKQPFFNDPAVVAAFAKHGLKVEVDTAGSREIATSPRLGEYDFAFPAGVPAAQKIRTDAKAATVYQPFSSPMAVASFKPIAEILRANGVAKPLANGYWQLDVRAYLDLVRRKVRWNQLKASGAYPSSKSVLISSTDIRSSNSAAMYLAITSYVANDDNIVQNNAEADKAVAQVAPLFLRQGYTESSSEEPFEDYLSIGSGKTPMVMVYEAQFLARKAAGDGVVDPDMVLLYPDPTVTTKHTLVPLKGQGGKVGQLLTDDPELQALAARYGFRTADRKAVDRYLAGRKVPAPPALVNVVEPPTYEVLEHMIQGVR